MTHEQITSGVRELIDAMQPQVPAGHELKSLDLFVSRGCVTWSVPLWCNGDCIVGLGATPELAMADAVQAITEKWREVAA